MIKKSVLNDMIWSSLIIYLNCSGHSVDLNRTKRYPKYDDLESLDFNIEIVFKNKNIKSAPENWVIKDNKLVYNFNFDSDLSYDHYNDSINEAILLLYHDITNTIKVF